MPGKVYWGWPQSPEWTEPPGPGSEGPPKMRAVLASYARAQGLLPLIGRGVRVLAFNSRQKQAKGPVIELPCTVVK